MDALIGGDSTEIGENGINISGGQKSRISLARGLYADKDIYIFDEPTSAIDARVGLSIIKKGISTFLSGKTRILVTQTIEYAAFADRIVYMKDGEIIWEGSFSEFVHQPFSKNYKLNTRNTQIALENSEKLKVRNSTLIEDNARMSLNYMSNTSNLLENENDISNLRELNLDVQIKSPTLVEVDVMMSITLKPGYVLSEVRTECQKVINEFFENLSIGEQVIFAAIGQKVFEVEGVKNYSFNEGSDIDQLIDDDELAVIGTLSISES